MPLFMRGEEKKHFVAACRMQYGEKPGRKAKSDIIDDLMQYVGYKSRKHAIRVLNRTPAKRKHKPRGRRKILTPPMLGLLRKIWAMQGYPCSRLLKASLPDWIEAWKNRNNISPEDERLKLIGVSASTLERALAPYRGWMSLRPKNPGSKASHSLNNQSPMLIAVAVRKSPDH